ncbi:MAG: DUF4349 domain-containing protein [Clostridiales bacterium]|nr:DUF4349 domain-containing protein [Clostridiales bacterium]
MRNRVIAILAVTLILSALFYGCGSSSNSYKQEYAYDGIGGAIADYDAKYSYGEYPTEYEYADAPMEAETATSTSAVQNRKIIYSVNMTLETRDFDSGIKIIEQLCKDQNGYIEGSTVSGQPLDYAETFSYRTAYYTLRIPVKSLDSSVDSLEKTFNVKKIERSSQDITDSYYDADARLKSLKQQETRLEEMLSGAEDLEYMIQIEDKLSEVRYQIESYYSMLQRYDGYVEYATLDIKLEEVVNYSEIKTPISFGERIRTAFVDSWKGFVVGLQNFAVGLVFAIPTLLVLAFIVVIIVIIIKTIIKSNNKRRLKKAQKYMKIMNNQGIPSQTTANTSQETE